MRLGTSVSVRYGDKEVTAYVAAFKQNGTPLPECDVAAISFGLANQIGIDLKTDFDKNEIYFSVTKK